MTSAERARYKVLAFQLQDSSSSKSAFSWTEHFFGMEKENTKKGKSQNAAFSKTFEKEKEQQVNSKEELEKREQKLREDLKAREEKLKEDLRAFDKGKEM